MDELKPCPFCGASARFWSQGGKYGLFTWIECDECGSRSKSAATHVPVDDPTFFDGIGAKRVAAHWNRRYRQ